MSEPVRVRWKLLKLMYALSIPGAGIPGLMMLVNPSVMTTVDEPVTTGLQGALTITFAVLAVLGLRAPLKFVPVLMFQLTYKVIWMVTTGLPLMVAGELPADAIPMTVIFVVFIVGDALAIPWKLMLGSRDAEAQPA